MRMLVVKHARRLRTTAQCRTLVPTVSVVQPKYGFRALLVWSIFHISCRSVIKLVNRHDIVREGIVRIIGGNPAVVPVDAVLPVCASKKNGITAKPALLNQPSGIFLGC